MFQRTELYQGTKKLKTVDLANENFHGGKSFDIFSLWKVSEEKVWLAIEGYFLYQNCSKFQKVISQYFENFWNILNFTKQNLTNIGRKTCFEASFSPDVREILLREVQNVPKVLKMIYHFCSGCTFLQFSYLTIFLKKLPQKINCQNTCNFVETIFLWSPGFPTRPIIIWLYYGTIEIIQISLLWSCHDRPGIIYGPEYYLPGIIYGPEYDQPGIILWVWWQSMIDLFLYGRKMRE